MGDLSEDDAVFPNCRDTRSSHRGASAVGPGTTGLLLVRSACFRSLPFPVAADDLGDCRVRSWRRRCGTRRDLLLLLQGDDREHSGYLLADRPQRRGCATGCTTFRTSSHCSSTRLRRCTGESTASRLSTTSAGRVGITGRWSPRACAPSSPRRRTAMTSATSTRPRRPDAMRRVKAIRPLRRLRRRCRHVVEFFPERFQDGDCYDKNLGIDAFSLRRPWSGARTATGA